MKYKIIDKAQLTDSIDLHDVLNKNIQAKQYSAINLSFNELNLGTCIYAKNINATKSIQKDNCKSLINYYKIIVKAIKFCKRNKIDFSYTFSIENLNAKQNNNDIMLLYLLEVRLNTSIFHKTSNSILFACDYLDLENKDHNMCDFQNNKCVKHRERGFNTTTGCCPQKCKFMKNCPCLTKNLSCKMILCDYLMNQGYYFTPHTIAVLKKHMTTVERLASWGMFFKSTKRTIRFIRFVRVLEILTSVLLISTIITTVI